MEWEKDLVKPLKNGENENVNMSMNSNCNWMSRLKVDFIQRLPQKLKSGLDSEDFSTLDLSAVQGLLQGN